MFKNKFKIFSGAVLKKWFPQKHCIRNMTVNNVHWLQKLKKGKLDIGQPKTKENYC